MSKVIVYHDFENPRVELYPDEKAHPLRTAGIPATASQIYTDRSGRFSPVRSGKSGKGHGRFTIYEVNW